LSPEDEKWKEIDERNDKRFRMLKKFGYKEEDSPVDHSFFPEYFIMLFGQDISMNQFKKF